MGRKGDQLGRLAPKLGVGGRDQLGHLASGAVGGGGQLALLQAAGGVGSPPLQLGYIFY